MYHGIRRDELIIANDKKRLKGMKDVKRRDVNAPPLDRIPLPALPENIKNEQRLAFRDIQLKKAKISAENPPSICLYTILNANNSVCCASISKNCGLYAIGYSNAGIQVDKLMSEELKVLKSAEELEMLDNEATVDELYVENSGRDTKSIALVGHCGPVYSVSFSCERRLLLSGSRDRTMRLWSLEMQRNLVIYRTLAPVWQAIFCNRGVYFAAATADQTVSLWATDRTQPIRIFMDAPADVTCLDFHPNCNYVIGGGDDGCIRVWDVLTATCVQKFTTAGHQAPIRAVKVSPCGRYIISADADGQVAAWDSSNHRAMGRQSCGEPIDFHVPIVFSRDGSAFAMATPRYGVTFFDADAMTNGNNSGDKTQNMNCGYNGYTASSSQQSQCKGTEHRGGSFSMFSYPTKRTSILDFHFTRRNTVVAVGVFNQ